MLETERKTSAKANASIDDRGERVMDGLPVEIRTLAETPASEYSVTNPILLIESPLAGRSLRAAIQHCPGMGNLQKQWKRLQGKRSQVSAATVGVVERDPKSLALEHSDNGKGGSCVVNLRQRRVEAFLVP